jgi:ribonuclease BN (tRNA processing enzyme)
MAMAACVVLLSPTSAPAQTSCGSAPLAVQVLGSGGPYAGGARASTSYLVWHRGRAVVLVDAGGGSFARFGEARAKLADLSLIAISHLHPDHVSDLPALLWLSEGARQQPLKIAGPSGAGPFPGMSVFTSRLFDQSTGAFPGLSGTLGQPGRGVRLEVVEVGAAVGTRSSVAADSIIQVTALGVPHANVPSLAYRITIGGRAIVFGSDQNGSSPAFSEFSSGADLLVMHTSISERAPEELARLHAKPSTVGQVAQGAKAKRLVLSHLIEPPASYHTPESFSLTNLSQTVSEVRQFYTGPVEAAVDLQCIPVP